MEDYYYQDGDSIIIYQSALRRLSDHLVAIYICACIQPAARYLRFLFFKGTV